jgi:mitochondrial cardiolipin hydrolase
VRVSVSDPAGRDGLAEAISAILAGRPLSRAQRGLFRDLVSQMPPRERAALLRDAFAHARQQPEVQGVSRLDALEKIVALVDRAVADRSAAAVVSEAHFSPGEDCRHRIVSLLDGAQRTLDVCVFTITDDPIAAAVLRAEKRGVRVRVITDDLKLLAPGSDIARFRRAGVSVATDQMPAHMHHKFALVDRWILIAGSYNWTRDAAVANLGDVISTSDFALVRAFSVRFDELWKRFG